MKQGVEPRLLVLIGSACVLQDLDGTNLDAAMAQHLLVAADRFALPRLRRICERRLCETVEVIPLHLKRLESPFKFAYI